MSTKNFNETLFDYKTYSLMNNNPIKKKTEFEKELKKTKKLKDNSMKKKKKKWIKIGVFEKEKKNDSLENENKIYLSKQNQKSKISFNNLKIISEEEINGELDKELKLKKSPEKYKQEDEEDLKNNYIKNNQIYKKSQDDFNIDLINNFGIDNDIANSSELFIGKYKQYLKNKNSKKNKDIKKIKKNYECDNNFQFFEDI